MNISETAFIHPAATVIGMVQIGQFASVWPGTILRGDMNQIILGDYVNIQDNSTVHTDSKRGVIIGDYTLVGHNAMLHGCTVGKAVLVGIGCVILDDAVIGDGAMVMAGCTVRGGKKIPPRAMVLPDGSDIKIIENKAKPVMTVAGSLEYVRLAERFRQNIFAPFTAAEEKEFTEQAKTVIKNLGL